MVKKRFILTACLLTSLLFASSPVNAVTITVINNGDCNCSGVSDVAKHTAGNGDVTYTCTGCGSDDCGNYYSIGGPGGGGTDYTLIDYAIAQIQSSSTSGSYSAAEPAWGNINATVTWTATCPNNYSVSEVPGP